MVYRLASGLQTTQAQMASLVNRGGQQGLVNCTIRPGKPTAFPTPQSSLYIIRLWAHGTAGYTRHGHSAGCLLFLKICRNLALVFGQVTSRGALFDKMLCADQQYPVRLPSWPRSSVFMARLLEESMVGKVKR